MWAQIIPAKQKVAMTRTGLLLAATLGTDTCHPHQRPLHPRQNHSTAFRQWLGNFHSLAR